MSKRILIAFAVPLLATWTTLGVFAMAGIRINYTRSLPLGLYRYTKHDTGLVALCLDPTFAILAFDRDYVLNGSCPVGITPILKPIVARPGDWVTLNAGGLSVNGRLLHNSAPRSRDFAGRPLLHFPYGTYLVEPATFWVLSGYDPRSFDSRYFGPIRQQQIVSYAEPLWTGN